MKIKIAIACLFLGFLFHSNFLIAQQDSLNTDAQKEGKQKKEKKNKNLKFSILGGPGFSPDFGFLIGGSALFTFSTNTADSSLKRSVLPVAFAWVSSGGGSMIVRPQLFFNHNKIQIFGQALFHSVRDNYYGVGFENNSNIGRHADSTEYRSNGYEISPILLFKYKNTPLFFGPSVDVIYKSMADPSMGVQQDEYYINDGGDSTGLKYLSVGLGLNIRYDTRDVPANPYKGILVELSAKAYPKAFGSTNDFGIFSLVYKQFEELKFLGKRKVLAWMVNTRFAVGDVPIPELSLIGSAFDLRGYYQGQYRDNNAIMLLAEYRHMFNFGDETKFRKLMSRFGLVAWVGLGTIDPDFKDYEGVLPNFGGGIRIEVQPRMNFRVDFGRDPINGQTLIYFNMTEAF